MAGKEESFYELMDLISACTDADIGTFVEGLGPESKAVFDTMSERRQLIMATLAKLSDDQVRNLRESMRDNFLVGFHDLGNELMILQSLRPDPITD